MRRVTVHAAKDAARALVRTRPTIQHNPLTPAYTARTPPTHAWQPHPTHHQLLGQRLLAPPSALADACRRDLAPRMPLAATHALALRCDAAVDEAPEPMQCISTMKRRRKKMNKHKLKKRRKRDRIKNQNAF